MIRPVRAWRYLCAAWVLSGCGDDMAFVAQPWAADHSAVAVWTNLDGSETRLAQAAPGAPLKLRLPNATGSLYARTYAPELRIGGKAVSECAVTLDDAGPPFPAPSSTWVAEVVDGQLGVLTEEQGQPRQFDLRAPDCTVVEEDPCDSYVFEELDVPPDFNSVTAARIDDDSFLVGGSDLSLRIPRLFRYDGSTSTEVMLPPGLAVGFIIRIRPLPGGKFLMMIQQEAVGLLYVLNSDGSLDRPIPRGVSHLVGEGGRTYSALGNMVFEHQADGNSTEVEAPPEVIDHLAAYRDGQVAMLGVNQLLTLTPGGWVALLPPATLASRLRLAGGPYRLFMVGGTEALLIYERDGTWTDGSGSGGSRYFTATDVSATTLVASGDRIMAVRGDAGWCYRESPTYAYFDSINLREGLGVMISSPHEGGDPLITLVRD